MDVDALDHLIVAVMMFDEDDYTVGGGWDLCLELGN